MTAFKSFLGLLLVTTVISSASPAMADDVTFDVGDFSYQVHNPELKKTTASISIGGKVVSTLSSDSMGDMYELLTKFITIAQAARGGNISLQRRNDGLFVYDGSKQIVKFPLSDDFNLDQITDAITPILKSAKAQKSDSSCESKLAQVNELLVAKSTGVNSSNQDVIKQAEGIINSTTPANGQAAPAR
jgi:hypothetical protein